MKGRNRGYRYLGMNGGKTKTGFPFPYHDKEALASGFLVGRNIHAGTQRKAGIHPVPEGTVLGWSSVGMIW